MTWQAGCSPPSKVAGRYQDGRLQAPVGRRPRQGPPGGPTRSSPLAFIHVLCYFYHLYFVFAFLFIFCLSFMELWYCISWQPGCRPHTNFPVGIHIIIITFMLFSYCSFFSRCSVGLKPGWSKTVYDRSHVSVELLLLLVVVVVVVVLVQRSSSA